MSVVPEERKSRYELFLEEEARNARTTKKCSRCGEVKALEEFHKGAPLCKRCRNPLRRKYKDKADRFWKNYHAHTIKVGECVEWIGTTHSGNLSIIRRKVYRLAVGKLNEGEFVLVACNNPQCVRQNHLKRGTKDDLNIKRINSLPVGDRNSSNTHPERLARGERHGSKTHPERLLRGENHPARLHPERLARGEDAHKSDLRESDIREIRRLGLTRDLSQRAIAIFFGITQRAVWNIVHAKTWKHVQ